VSAARARRDSPADSAAAPVIFRKSRRRTVIARFSEALEHDPEKWAPVFRKDHAQIKS
jgi:hypothetical protein